MTSHAPTILALTGSTVVHNEPYRVTYDVHSPRSDKNHASGADHSVRSVPSSYETVMMDAVEDLRHVLKNLAPVRRKVDLH
jgi:hypothetical protein